MFLIDSLKISQWAKLASWVDTECPGSRPGIKPSRRKTGRQNPLSEVEGRFDHRHRDRAEEGAGRVDNPLLGAEGSIDHRDKDSAGRSGKGRVNTGESVWKTLKRLVWMT